MTIIDVVSDNVITVDVHSLCRLRGQVDRRATPLDEALESQDPVGTDYAPLELLQLLHLLSHEDRRCRETPAQD